MKSRRRQTLKKQVVQKEKTSISYGRKLVLRIFCSVLLILAAIFIKQNAPHVAEAGRNALSVWTVAIPFP